VAVLFQPIRLGLQRGVNRLMYGESDDPRGVVSRLGQRLEGMLAPEAVLSTIVQTVREALRLPYVVIELADADGRVIASARCPTTTQADRERESAAPQAGALRLALAYRGETAGKLIVAPRAPGERFSPNDHRLLAELAVHAGAALFAVRTTLELQRTRERVVAAREEERRRLRRDLHDGLGPQLATLTMKLDTAQAVIEDDPAAGRALVTEVQAQLKETLGLVRRLVYALRPPILDQLGLPDAIRQFALRELQGQSVALQLDVPDRLAPLPPAVELAAYYIASEALTNVIRHARASHCRVRLDVCDRQLELEVADDGCGWRAADPQGVGLQAMRERAEELGGVCRVLAASPVGTRLFARLPLGQE
jgi:signal transduction histidine kinase